MRVDNAQPGAVYVEAAPAFALRPTNRATSLKRLPVAIALVFLALCGPLIAGAAASTRWASVAAAVFTTIAQDADLPNAAFPGTFAQDADGFLWIGTENGLARWDGYHFRIFKADAADPGSLPDSIINALHLDTRGRLWIGTNSGGIVRYDRDRDRFVREAGGSGGLSAGEVDDW